MNKMNTKRKDTEMRSKLSMRNAKDRAVVWNLIARNSRNRFTIGGKVETVECHCTCHTTSNSDWYSIS